MISLKLVDEKKKELLRETTFIGVNLPNNI